MTEPEDRSYQLFQDGLENRAQWNKFFVILAGTTNGAHQNIVSKLKSAGHTEAFSPAGCHYCIIFCPIVSRLGSDVSSALSHIISGIPTFLVVMHHTTDPNKVVLHSRDIVQNPDVHVVVDCLFHNSQMHNCTHNKMAWSIIKKYLGLQEGSILPPIYDFVQRYRVQCLVGALVLLAVIVIVTVEATKKNV